MNTRTRMVAVLFAFLVIGMHSLAQELHSCWDELGQLVTEHHIESLVKALKAIKADTKTIELQNEFFNRLKNAP